MANGKLTLKQERFVIAYLECENASEASRRAGYPAKSARVIGTENLTKPAIAARLQELRDRVAVAAEDTVMTVVQRKEMYSEIARTPCPTPPTHRDRIAAADKLSLLDHSYELGPTINQDNRTVNIYVVDDEARELLGRVKDRTREVESD
ncbi:hypothetical protein LCGC14_0993090 [marine sediment metagenome]|uniref:Terminase small subunit n=1 Tax=marine sediment metagenome TaxID=412755 RepID=A0A0F9QNN0_9ZZZZ